MAELQQKPTAPTMSDDLPPPYSAVMAGDPAGPAYPQMGFVQHVQSTPPNTYPHPPQAAPPTCGYPPPHAALPSSYPHAGPTPHFPQDGYIQHAVMMDGTQGPVPVNVVVSPPVGSDPTNMVCRGCGQQITTKVQYRTSWHTHLVAGIICFGTMFLSLCCFGLLPYCFDSCKSADHYCPNCNTYLGKYDRC